MEQKMKIGKFNCRATYKIIGLTNRAIEDFNKLISKEETQDGKDEGDH